MKRSMPSATRYPCLPIEKNQSRAVRKRPVTVPIMMPCTRGFFTPSFVRALVNPERMLRMVGTILSTYLRIVSSSRSPKSLRARHRKNFKAFFVIHIDHHLSMAMS